MSSIRVRPRGRRRVRFPLAAASCGAAFLLAFGTPLAAQLSEAYRAWGEGPATHLFTAEEEIAWRAVTTDSQAEEFAQLFWARRDPVPGTPDNEFRQEFERRVAFADQRFATGNLRGSRTAQGQVFIVLGPPTRVQGAGSRGSLGGGDMGTGDSTFGGGGTVTEGTGPGKFGTGGTTDREGVASIETWTYEDERVPAVLGRKRLKVAFRTKPGSDESELWQSNDTLTALAAVAQAQVVNRDLTAADLQPAAAGGGPRAWRARPVTEAAWLEALTAVDAGATSGDLEAAAFRASDGTWIVPLQVSTTDDVAAVPAPRLVGEVREAGGQRLLAFELAAEWETAGDQHFLQETLLLSPGTYTVTAGIADAAGAIRWAGRDELTVPEGGDTFWLSDLILGHDIHPMTEAQQMLEPFAWQGIALVPRTGEKFHAGGDLWLYVHACNVTLDATGKPQLRVIAQLTGPKKFRGPLAVEPSDAGEGCWVVAQALDASAFVPGEYGLALQVTDTGAGRTLTSERAFTIVP